MKGIWTMTHPRDLRLVAVLALIPLMAGCGSLVPAEGPSKLAQRPRIDSGPSAQRQDADGYPVLGAFPKSASAQLTEPEVIAERGALKATGTRQNVGVGTAASDYRRSLAEAAAVRAQARRQVDAAVAKGAGGSAAESDADGADVLRQIEGN